MRICSKIFYELKYGVWKRKWWYLLYGISVFFLLYLFDATIILDSEIPYQNITMGNLLMYLFEGKEVFYPETGEPFIFPVIWLYIFLYILISNLDYPFSQIMEFGTHQFYRYDSRSSWWNRKFFWTLASTLILWVCFYGGLILFCLWKQIPLTLDYSQSVHEQLLGYDISGFGQTEIILYCILLPILVSVSLCFTELLLQFYLKKIYVLLLLFAYLFACTYFSLPVLLGNYAMVERSKYAMDGTMTGTHGVVLCVFLSLVCYGIGRHKVKRFDIIKKQG